MVYNSHNMKDMLGRDNVISVEKALQLLLDALPAGAPREVNVETEESLGMVCARDVVAEEDLPGFARSTVDGYAVAAADTFGAAETMPAYIKLLGAEILMGERADFLLPRGAACGIPTGGMLPAGADAVVMFEYVQPVDAGMIEALRPVAPGDNVIQAGEDVRKGETVISRGRRIRPQDMGACAGIGITEVRCYERLTVSIISTGDEIVPASAAPEPGQVRDINSYVLSGMAAEAGCRPVRRGIFRDDYAALRDVIEASMKDSDIIALSGGTSVGVKDMVARIISDIGSPGVLFHGVSVKPGKPIIGGVIQGIPIFGLPGHPAAVSVCFELFIGPVIRRLSGVVESPLAPMERMVKARLARNVSSSAGREEHVRVLLEKRADGLWAVPVLGKSGLISTLVKADGVFVIPLNANGVEQDETVEVRLF